MSQHDVRDSEHDTAGHEAEAANVLDSWEAVAKALG